MASDSTQYEPTDLVSETQERYCPSCGARTAETFCPVDGVQTVVRHSGTHLIVPIQPGDVVAGRYRIIGLIGRGGFASVYSAEHTSTQHRVALKVMYQDTMAASEGTVRRFYREARVTARLRHPNTVHVFDVGQSETGALFIAMELLSGPTLEQLLRDLLHRYRVLTEPEAVKVGIDILRSLGEAHQQGLVHRDMKPANVIVTEVGDETLIKVLDFGIAQSQTGSAVVTQIQLGTPAYMSPEQCEGGAVDGRSDIYALGILLYRCVAAVLPFADANPLTLLFKHTSVEAPNMAEAARIPISKGFASIVTRCLAKRPSDRFGTAREMREALEALESSHTRIVEFEGGPIQVHSDDSGIFDIQPVTDHSTKVDVLAHDTIHELPSRLDRPHKDGR